MIIKEGLNITIFSNGLMKEGISIFLKGIEVNKCNIRLNINSPRGKEFLNKCKICPIISLCMWCSAHSYLETGEMDSPVEYFCAVARFRAEWLKWSK